MRKAFRNNKGIALVSVMVLLTVCMLMATVIVEITYSSLLSRRVNTRSDNNFYSAEAVIDDLESVVQSLAIQATKDIQNSNTSFVDGAANRIVTAAKGSGYSVSSINDSDKSGISNYMFDQLSYDVQKILGKEKKDESGNVITDESGNVVYERDENKFEVGAIKIKSGSGTEKGTLAINVKLSYEDPETGYLTNLSTDLVMHDVTYRTPVSAYGYGSYAMFTGGGGHFYGNLNNLSGNKKLCGFFQEGNSYYGTKENSTESVSAEMCVVIFDGDKVVINGDLKLTDHAAVIFTGKREKNGKIIYPEIDIRGTIYIDGTSVMSIGEGCNFMCKDIVLTDTGLSFWDINPSSQESKFGVYNGFYPYNYTTKEAVKNAAKGATNDLYVEYTGDGGTAPKTAGCVMYRTNSNSWVLGYDAANNKYTLNGVNNNGVETTLGSTKINKSSSFIPSAKATIWTYDNKAITVDSELAKFANINVMYLKNNTSNSLVAQHDIQLMNYTDDMELTMENVNSPKGGAPLSVATYKDSSGNYLKYQNFSTTIGFDGSSGVYGNSDILDGDIKLAIVQTPLDAPLNPTNGQVILYSRFGKYTIHGEGGRKNMGMFISTDCVEFMAQDSGTYVVYSLIDTKNIDDSSAADVQNIVKRIAYSSSMFSQVSGKSITDSANNFTGFGFSGEECEKYASGMMSINSNFLNGVESLLEEGDSGDDAGGGKVSLTFGNIYDFVSIENWQQN